MGTVLTFPNADFSAFAIPELGRNRIIITVAPNSSAKFSYGASSFSTPAASVNSKSDITFAGEMELVNDTPNEKSFTILYEDLPANAFNASGRLVLSGAFVGETNIKKVIINIQPTTLLEMSVLAKLSGIRSLVINGKVHTCYFFLNGAENLEKVDLSGADFSPITGTSAYAMFKNCYSLEEFSLCEIHAFGNVSNISNLFDGCRSLRKVDFTGFDTTRITNISNLFRNCTSLSQIVGFGQLDFSGVTDADSIISTYQVAENFKIAGELDMSCLTMENAKTWGGNVFADMPNINTINLDGFVGNATLFTTERMVFANMPNLTKVKCVSASADARQWLIGRLAAGHVGTFVYDSELHALVKE